MPRRHACSSWLSGTIVERLKALCGVAGCPLHSYETTRPVSQEAEAWMSLRLSDEALVPKLAAGVLSLAVFMRVTNMFSLSRLKYLEVGRRRSDGL